MRFCPAYLSLISALTAATGLGCVVDETPTTSVGAAAVGDVSGGVPPVTCDPLRQDCAGGSNCTLVGNSIQCVVVVVDGAEGEECQEETECGLGLACLAASLVPACEGFKCCTPLCALDEASFTCPGADAGAECAPALTGPVGQAHGDLGVCRLR